MTEGWQTRLEKAVADDPRTPRAISKAAGLNANYLSELFNLGKAPSIDKLLALCEVLNISAAWVLTGLKASRRSEEMLVILGQLPEDQQTTLLDLARQLKAAEPR